MQHCNIVTALHLQPCEHAVGGYRDREALVDMQQVGPGASEAGETFGHEVRA